MESIEVTNGPGQADAFPRPVRPVNPRSSFPLDPRVASGHLPEKGAFERIAVGAPAHFSGPRCVGGLEDKGIQIGRLSYRSKCPKASLDLELNAKISPSCVFLTRVSVRSLEKVHGLRGFIDNDLF